MPNREMRWSTTRLDLAPIGLPDAGSLLQVFRDRLAALGAAVALAQAAAAGRQARTPARTFEGGREMLPASTA